MYWITPISDRCYRSIYVVTPARYERDYQQVAGVWWWKTGKMDTWNWLSNQRSTPTPHHPLVTNDPTQHHATPTLNTLRPRPNRRHFADEIFKCISENENGWISPSISLKFVPKVRINNIPALVQIMAWRRPGDKPLSEPMMVRLPTHICVTLPQWVKPLRCIQPQLNTAIQEV